MPPALLESADSQLHDAHGCDQVKRDGKKDIWTGERGVGARRREKNIGIVLFSLVCQGMQGPQIAGAGEFKRVPRWQSTEDNGGKV